MQTLKRPPGKYVFGVVDRSEEVEEIVEDVALRGVDRDEVQVVTEEKEENSSAADQHPVRDGVVHAAEQLSEEHEFTEAYQRQIEHGGSLVGIPVSRAIKKEAAQDILHRHGAHFINYYGPLVVEELEG